MDQSQSTKGTSQLALVAAGLLAVGSLTSPARADDAELVKRGEYLATLGDCVACHSAPGGEKFAGGLYMKTPVGSIATPNITPDNETGIGKWTDEQFYRAMHEGIGAHGEYLYPAYPFPWYTNVKKEDVQAIHAYLKSLKPVHAPRKPLEMGFPFNVREGLLAWRLAFFKENWLKIDPKASPEVQRGAYIVEGLGHCGECHNANKLTGASNLSGTLQGGQIEGYYAPNITSNRKDGVGAWSETDIVTYLKTGSKPDHTSVAAGPMREEVMDSTSKMTDADLHAIAAYLKSFQSDQSISASESSKGAPVPVAGEEVYLSYCVSCHQRDGKGIAGAVPALAGNGSVTAKGPQNVIRAVLGGLYARDGLSPMPAYGQTMTDQQVADVTNYVRSAWGNGAPADTGPGEVGALRDQALTMLAMNRPGACAPAKEPAQAVQKAAEQSDVKSKLETMDPANMLPTIDGILPDIKKGAPGATPDQISNGMTAAYCPIVMQKFADNQKSKVIGDFAVLTYGQAKKNGTDN